MKQDIIVTSEYDGLPLRSLMSGKLFMSNTMIKKAKLYATAMGNYELWINGERMGEDWFTPGDSQFREVMGYHAYDVTAMLKTRSAGVQECRSANVSFFILIIIFFFKFHLSIVSGHLLYIPARSVKVN